MNNRYYNKIKGYFMKKYSITYSQLGEDLIIKGIFNSLKIKNPSYLDIGTNDPRAGSNTYLLYKNGSRGICIEPNPVFYKKIKRVRPGDTVLNVGIGRGEGELYVMDNHALSTFSKEEALRMEKMGHVIKKTLKVNLVSVNDVMTESTNLVSIDTEGMDYEILKDFDFKRFKPQVFCIETLTYEKNKPGNKIPEISRLMEENGYIPFADTHLNTIFVHKV